MTITAPALRLLPVGHYLGPYHSGQGLPARCHRLRVGREPRNLWSDEQLVAWVLAHGVPGELDRGTWTRASVAEQGRLATGAELDTAIDDLLDDDLLVEVPSGDAAGFARTHRLRALLTGMGPDPDDPDGGSLLGLPGQATVPVPPLAAELWLWSQRTTTLWAACERLAEAVMIGDGEATATGTTPDGDGGSGDRVGPVSAADLLPAVLAAAHTLLAAGAAYLDTVDDEPAGGAGEGGTTA